MKTSATMLNIAPKTLLSPIETPIPIIHTAAAIAKNNNGHLI